MNQSIVTEAVRSLRARQQRVTVRAVHALTGGSFRDLSRLLRNSAEFLADDEVAELGDNDTEVLTPARGKTLDIWAAAKAAEEVIRGRKN